MKQKNFSKKFAEFKISRHYFSKVLIIALSITIISNVLRFIGQSLHLYLSIRINKQLLNWLNII